MADREAVFSSSERGAAVESDGATQPRASRVRDPHRHRLNASGKRAKALASIGLYELSHFVDRAEDLNATGPEAQVGAARRTGGATAHSGTQALARRRHARVERRKRFFPTVSYWAPKTLTAIVFPVRLSRRCLAAGFGRSAGARPPAFYGRAAAPAAVRKNGSEPENGQRSNWVNALIRSGGRSARPTPHLVLCNRRGPFRHFRVRNITDD